jgi:hypothetical protein
MLRLLEIVDYGTRVQVTPIDLDLAIVAIGENRDVTQITAMEML